MRKPRSPCIGSANWRNRLDGEEKSVEHRHLRFAHNDKLRNARLALNTVIVLHRSSPRAELSCDC